MTAFIALLRAVNVGGTGKLPMSDLKEMCEALGFRRRPHLHRQRQCRLHQPQIRSRGEEGAGSAPRSLRRQTGRRAGAHAAEMQAVLKDNPFPKAARRTGDADVHDEPPRRCRSAAVKGRRTNRSACGRREIYVHYGDGMGKRSVVHVQGAKSRRAYMNAIAQPTSRRPAATSATQAICGDIGCYAASFSRCASWRTRNACSNCG